MQEMESNAMNMSKGWIAVIVCFGVAFVAVVCAMSLWWLRRRRRRSSDDAGHPSTKVHMTVDHHRSPAHTSMTGGTDSAGRTSSGDDIHPDDHDNDEFYLHHQSPPRLVRNEIWIDPHHDIDDISTLEGGTVPPPQYFDGALVATAFLEDRPTTAASSNPAVVLTSWSDWGRDRNRVVETTPQRWMDPNNDVDDDADIITLDVPTVPREYGDVGTDEPTASVNFEFENTRRHLYHHSTDNQEDRTHSYRTGLSSNPTVMTSWSKLGMSAAELDFAEDTSFEEQFR
jgi:hypothetical protein